MFLDYSYTHDSLLVSSCDSLTLGSLDRGNSHRRHHKQNHWVLSSLLHPLYDFTKRKALRNLTSKDFVFNLKHQDSLMLFVIRTHY